MQKKIRICLLLISLFLLLAFSAHAACTDNDGDGFGTAYVNVTGNKNGGNHFSINYTVNTTNTLAQSFTVAKDTTIVRIGLRLNRCFPNFNNVTVQVRSDLNKPNDYLIQYGISHDEMPQGPNGGWHYELVNFNVGGGKTYYLAVGSPAAGKNPHCWIYNKSGDPYKNGQLFEKGVAIDGGKSDAVFELYEAGDLTECKHRNIADCNDNDANVLPPYENMVLNNNDNKVLCPGHYNLTDSDQNGTIRVWGQNTTLICNNTWIEGNLSPVSAAVRIETSTQNFLLGGNCTFSSFGFGGVVVLGGASDGRILNVTTHGNDQSGITLTNTAHNWLLSNLLVSDTQNGPDILFDINTQNNTLENSMMRSGGGVRISANSSNNTIKNNTIRDSNTYGIEINMHDRARFTNNDILDNNITNCSDGIHSCNARGIQIINNTVLNSRGDGIYVDPSNRINITGNRIINSTGNGITITNNTNATVYNNTAIYNAENGIEVSYFANATVHNNTFCYNGRDAIYKLSATILPANFLSVNVVNCSNANLFRNAWLTQIRTIFSNKSNASGATVNSYYPVSNTTVQSTDTTDSNGLTGFFELTEYIIDNTNTQINYTPYRFYGFLNYYDGENITLGNMTRIASLGNEVIITLRTANLTINITSPQDNSSRKEGTNFVLSAAINNTGTVNSTGCNATLNITDTSAITLRTGNWMHAIGNIAAGTAITQTWNLRALNAGSANATITLVCDNAAPINDTVTNLNVTPALPAPKYRGGGGGRSYYIQQETQEKPPETESQEETIEEKLPEKKKPEESDNQEQKTTVPLPEIKKENPQIKVLKHLPNTAAILPGALLIIIIVGTMSYFILRKKAPTKPKPSRRKEKIDLERLGFKVKKK